MLYIGGESRSGSTVLSAILGSYDGFVSIGELRTIWRALKTNQLCGCGDSISLCSFWTAVGDRAYGGWASLDIDALLGADRRLARHRSVAIHIARGTRRAAPDLEAHRETIGRLYEAIRVVSGCRIIVDSTKDPSYAYVLRGVPGIDFRVANLVRDSRGVAYSNAKRQIVMPELAQSPSGEASYMPTWPFWRTAISWDVKNLLFYLLVRASECRLVKYENLVAHPTAELGAIRDFVGAKSKEHGSWDEESRSFEIFPHHTLGGNPVRFERGACAAGARR